MEQSAKCCQLPNILKFRHQKRTSLQYTLLHPEMERIESEIDKALNIFTDLAPPLTIQNRIPPPQKPVRFF